LQPDVIPLIASIPTNSINEVIRNSRISLSFSYLVIAVSLIGDMPKSKRESTDWLQPILFFLWHGIEQQGGS
jgi:hypothetical protein